MMIKLILIFLQIGLGFVVLLGIYMLFALLDSDFGVDGLIGLIIFQPILGCIISALSIGICFIIGLPIRLNKQICKWWKKHFYLSIILLIGGLIILLLSLHPALAESVKISIDGYETVKNTPNEVLLSIGWFLTAFSILHLYPPARRSVQKC
jgi:hypothetical protein